MELSTLQCDEFVEVLASKAAVPGGGGASALVAAIGTALGNMVGSLTVGKKKYIDIEEEMWALKARCDIMQNQLLSLVERDAEFFEPLSKAYGMPKDTPEQKAEIACSHLFGQCCNRRRTPEARPAAVRAAGGFLPVQLPI